MHVYFINFYNMAVHVNITSLGGDDGANLENGTGNACILVSCWLCVCRACLVPKISHSFIMQSS